MRIGFGISLAAPMVAALSLTLPDPVISFTGSGYAGSVYAVTNGGTGKWQRGPAGVWSDIGATTASWAMTPLREGDPIRWLRDDGVASNTIEMLMPGDLGLVDFDARVGKTTASGLVTQWVDRATGIIATQPTAARQPTDSGDYITNAVGTGITLAAQAIPYQISTSGGSAPTLQIGGSSYTASLSAIGATLPNLLVVNGHPSIAANAQIYQNGALKDATVGGTNVTSACSFSFIFEPTSITTWHMFTTAAGQGLSMLNRTTDYARGAAGKVRRMCYNSTTRLTDTQRQQLEGILAWTYGLAGNLPSDHPYKSAAPRSQ